MSAWDALSSAMRTFQARRIGPRDVERLLAGGPAGPEHSGLAGLLSAASAPARPDELAGESAAVAAFVRAHREPPPDPAATPVRRYRPASRLRRLTVLKVATGVALGLAGGTAFAAETGYLPDTVQQRAHELFSSLGVPPPRIGGDRDTVPPAPGGDRPPAPVTPPGQPPQASMGPLELCRAWDAARRDPKAGPRTTELRDLIAAISGTQGVPAFCAKLLNDAGQPSADPTPPTGAATPTPAQPGNGNGNGNGNGKGRPSKKPHP